MSHTKPTAATLHTQLQVHIKENEERWKTNFKQLDKLEESIARLQWWIIGGVTTIGVALFTLILTFLIRLN
jgi:hypothetical protein|tara:strand:- start:7746 stop:7958 length:213 start_codon:yes stop_codon:yes gene_type:complete